MGIALDNLELRLARRAFGLSQEGLARKSGLSVRTVSRAESGGRVQRSTLRALAGVLRRRPDSLVPHGCHLQLELDFRYDAALSFAGEDRRIAEDLAGLIVDGGYRVFYDFFEQDDLWGKDLIRRLAQIYEHDSRYCIILISEPYTRKLWARHELGWALRRALRERDDYILPLRLDDSQPEGLPTSLCFLDLRSVSVESVYQAFHKKMERLRSDGPMASLLRRP